MLKFDETVLVRVLDQLPAWKRVAFAAACAERLRPAYLAFPSKTGRGDSLEFEELLNRLWADLDGRHTPGDEVEASIERCMHLIPEEDDEPWDESQVYAENAGTALAYALRCRQNGHSQEAAWAARHVYEALDYYVIEHGGVDVTASDTDVQVISHPLIQAELVRQRRDIEQILSTRDDMSESVAVLRPLARREAGGLFGSAL